jgi:hypothetical protein
MRTFLIVLAVLAATLAGVVLLAGRLWRAGTAEAVARLQAATPDPATFSGREISGLPAPVARYLRAALREGQPLPRTARLHGTGSMRAKALGLFTVVSVERTPQIATAALQRWLAEAAWYPAALLPSQGTEWTGLDETSARARRERPLRAHAVGGTARRMGRAGRRARPSDRRGGMAPAGGSPGLLARAARRDRVRRRRARSSASLTAGGLRRRLPFERYPFLVRPPARRDRARARRTGSLIGWGELDLRGDEVSP